jgi:hypothetical protein
MLRLFPLTLSGWALGGFYLSLTPSLVVTATGVHSPFVGAGVVSALMLSGGISVLALRGLPAPVAVLTASLLLAIGIALTMVAIFAGSPAGMFFGTIIAGVGFGCSYGAALRTLLPLAASHERAGLLSASLSRAIFVSLCQQSARAWRRHTTALSQPRSPTGRFSVWAPLLRSYFRWRASARVVPCTSAGPND